MVTLYTFQADIICATCIDGMVANLPDYPTDNPDFNHDFPLEAYALHKGIDPTDEYTYDSDDFPKEWNATSITDYPSYCGCCHKKLTDGHFNHDDD